MDQATEIILTLGQAFEVAYQIALKDKLNGQAIYSPPLNKLPPRVASPSNPLSSMKKDSNSIHSPLSTNPSHHHQQQQQTLINQKNENNLQNNTLSNLKAKPTRSKPSSPNPLSTFIGSHTLKPISKSSSNSSSRDPSPRSGSINNSAPNHNYGSLKRPPTNPKPAHQPPPIKFLSSHGRSHSQNDIKINGNQLKLAPAPVDDINIGGVKDMKAGSRAPIAITDEL